MPVAHPWSVFAREVSNPQLDARGSDEAPFTDGHSSDEEDSCRRACRLRTGRSVVSLSEISTRLGDSDADRGAEVPRKDDGLASMDLADSLVRHVEDLLTDHLFRMEARLYKFSTALEGQEELAQRRHSEVQKRISVLENSAMFASPESFSATSSNSMGSKLIQAPLFTSLREEVMAQLERHDIRLGAVEASLQVATGQLEQLKAEFALLPNISAHQDKLHAVDVGCWGLPERRKCGGMGAEVAAPTCEGERAAIIVGFHSSLRPGCSTALDRQAPGEEGPNVVPLLPSSRQSRGVKPGRNSTELRG